MITLCTLSASHCRSLATDELRPFYRYSPASILKGSQIYLIKFRTYPLNNQDRSLILARICFVGRYIAIKRVGMHSGDCDEGTP